MMKKKRNEDKKKDISELTIVSASCFGVSASVSLCRPAQTRSSVKDGGAYFILFYSSEYKQTELYF